MLDPVLLAELEGIHGQFDGELVHDAFDREGGFGASGAAVGVGGHLVGEHVGAREPVRVELVDAVEHECAEDRHTRGDETQIGAHVGEQFHFQAGDGAVAARGEGQLLDLVAAVVRGEHRLAARLGVLDGLVQATSDEEREHLLRGDLQLATETAAHVGGDDAQFVFGETEGHREHQLQHVWDLGGRPHGDLRGGGVDDDRPRFHESGDEPLLPEGPFDDHLRVADRVFDVATATGLGGVEHPRRADVGAEIGVDEIAVLRRALEIEHDRQVLVVHIDRIEGVVGLVCAAGHHDCDGFTREVHGVDCEGRGVRGLHVLGDRHAHGRLPCSSARSAPV